MGAVIFHVDDFLRGEPPSVTPSMASSGPSSRLEGGSEAALGDHRGHRGGRGRAGGRPRGAGHPGEVAGLDGLRPEHVPFDLGSSRYLKTGEVLPDSVLRRPAEVRRHLPRAPWATRASPPGVLEKGLLLLKLRFAFHQYINLRPVKLFPGVETPIKGKGPAEIDMVVVRENNEDLYVGAGGFTYKGTPEEVAIQTSINTRAGVERCLRYAFDLARKRAEARVFPGLSAADGTRACAGRSRWWPRPTC